MCSGTPARSVRRPTSRWDPTRTRAVRSSASSNRTPASATTPAEAIRRSTSPRASAALHADRRDPSRVTAVARPGQPGPAPPPAPPWGRLAAVEWLDPEGVELVGPSGGQLVAVGGDDLVRPGLRPGPAVPGPAQHRSWLLAGMFGAPVGLVAVQVVLDLPGPGAERPHHRTQLGDLTGLGVQRVSVSRERCPEPGVGHHRGVPDPVDRLQTVADPDRVQRPPLPRRPHPGVDLQVQMAVRVPGPGGVVPHHRGLDLLHRDLDLPPPRPHPGRRMLGEPAHDLGRGPVLGHVVGRRDLRIQHRGQRPGLRTVHRHLDEPHRLLIAAEPALGSVGLHHPAGHPPLISRPVQRRQPEHPVPGGDQPGRQPGPLSQVVIIGTRPVRLDIRAGSSRVTPVDLHPTMHPKPPALDNHQQPQTRRSDTPFSYRTS